MGGRDPELTDSNATVGHRTDQCRHDDACGDSEPIQWKRGWLPLVACLSATEHQQSVLVVLMVPHRPDSNAVLIPTVPPNCLSVDVGGDLRASFGGDGGYHSMIAGGSRDDGECILSGFGTEWAFRPLPGRGLNNSEIRDKPIYIRIR